MTGRRRDQLTRFARFPVLLALLPSIWIGLLVPARAAGQVMQWEDETAEIATAEFMTGRYASALDRFAALYTRTGEPIYLRNLARCHQMLRHPTDAIDFFRRYLAEATDLTDAERAEIGRYISEMQDLERAMEQTALAARSVVPVAAVPRATVVTNATQTTAPLPPSTARQGSASAKSTTTAAFGLSLRLDVDGRGRGYVLAPGLVYRLHDRLELGAAALIGEHKGGWIGGRLLLIRSALRPCLTAGIPVFAVEGPQPGAQIGAGLVWDVSRGWSATAEMTVAYFPNVPASLEKVNYVPALGLIARL